MRVPGREKRIQKTEWSKKTEHNFPVLKACISVLKNQPSAEHKWMKKDPP